MTISTPKDFVQECLMKGVSRSEIQRALKEAGWPEREIEESLTAYVDAGLSVPVPLCKASISPREAFWHLLLFCSLFLWVFSLGRLCFDFINVLLPLPTDYISGITASLRYGIAMLIISFPVYLFSESIIQKDLINNPARGIAPIRRWLTYLTIFIATLILIGDAVALIVRFLEGEITLRFFLKVSVVAGLAGGVFAYLFRNLKFNEISKGKAQTYSSKYARKLLMVIIVVTCLIALYVTGGPFKARLFSQDQQRVRDLRRIYYNVQSYYHKEEKLPQTLGDCDSNPNTFISNKKDPYTGSPYFYHVTGDSTFELRAQFNLPSQQEGGGHIGKGSYWGPQDEDFWWHGAGLHTYTIELGKLRSRD